MKRNNIPKHILKERIEYVKKNPIEADPLTKKGVESILAKRQYKDERYMMATTAYHLLGDISREQPTLCYIGSETDKYYIGNWITGFGFFDVLFPKETTRPLTKEEIEEHNNMFIQIGSQPARKLKVD